MNAAFTMSSLIPVLQSFVAARLLYELVDLVLLRIRDLKCGWVRDSIQIVLKWLESIRMVKGGFEFQDICNSGGGDAVNQWVGR